MKFSLNRLRFDRIMVMSLWPHFFGQPCRTVIESHSLPVERNYRRAVPITGSDQSRLRHLLTSALDMATRLLPAIGTCFSLLVDSRRLPAHL